VYPEKTLDTATGIIGSLKNAATITVTVAHPIPTALQGTVHIDWFDPDNPIGSTKIPSDTNNIAASIRDNHGIILNLNPKTMVFNHNSSTRQSAKLNIGNAYAGDNYIIAAHPNSGVLSKAKIDSDSNITVPAATQGSGGSPSGGSGGAQGIPLDKSPTLTVWRTLWAEKDVMTHNLETADAALIDGFVKWQLAGACIDLKEYSPNLSVTIAGDVPRPDWTQTLHDKYSAIRNSPFTSDTFWTVHTIGAFEHESDLHSEFVIPPNSNNPLNTIYIFNTKIQASYPSSPENPDSNSAKRGTLLYELGHAFGLEDVTDENDAEYNTIMGGEGLLENQSFSTSQLRSIQSQSRIK
jgi:hypothetical protein